MRTKFTQLFSFIVLISNFIYGGTTTPAVMQWATHVDITKNVNAYNAAHSTSYESTDWCYAVKKLHDGCFIACGYSFIYDLAGHANVGPTIIKLDPNGNVLWHNEYDVVGIGSFGVLTDIVEAANGNLGAVGYQQGPLSNPQYAIMILTDKDGNQLNASTALLPAQPSPGANTESANNICTTPDGQYLVSVISSNSTVYQGYLEKTDGFTVSSTPFVDASYNSSSINNGFFGVQIGNVTSSTEYDVVLTGNHEVSTLVIHGINNADGTPPPKDGIAPKNEIDIYLLHYSSGAFSIIWHQFYKDPIFVANHHYDDTGPYSPSSSNGCSPNDSPFLDAWFNAPHNNLPAAVSVSKITGNIILCAYVGLVWPGDVPGIFSNGIPGVPDCIGVRTNVPPFAGTNIYDELKDADGYVLQVDYGSGSVIPMPSGQDNPIHVGHFSGDDFRMGMVEDNCGSIYVTGTCAADNLGTTSTDLGTIPDYEDILLCKVSGTHDRLWRRHFNSPGLYPDPGVAAGTTVTENCPFNITLNPEDNSVVICGNNGERGDDFIFIKMSSDEQATNSSWGISNPPSNIIDINPGTTYWNTNATVMGKVIVHSGATLDISNCILQFAETKEVNDYNAGDFSSLHPCGIWVETGGRLYIHDGATLRGMIANPHSSCSRDYMWDGITVEGDPTQPESGTTQGVLEIIGGSTIQDARCGIRYDSKTYYKNQPETFLINDVTWDRGRLSYPEFEGHGGGFGLHDQSSFINCRKSVEFLPYTYQNTATGFSSCRFLCNGPMVDPDFLDFDAFSNTYTRAGLNTHISIWDVHNIRFSSNSFSNTGSFTWDKRGAGISSIDADYKLFSNNYFWTMTYGIYASDGDPSYTISSDQSHFLYNSRGIYNLGINNQTYTNNEFQVGYNGKRDYGIYLEECTDYIVEQNRFLNADDQGRLTTGIIDYFSHLNSNENLIYNNYFESFDATAINAEGLQNDGAARGLQMRCNEYNLNTYDEYTPNLYPTLGPLQGIKSSQGDPTPAGAANNMFDTPCGATPWGELYNEPNGFIQTYKYFHCANGGGYITVPTSPCYTPTWVNPFNLFIPFDRAQDCPNLYRVRSEGDDKDDMDDDKNQKQSLIQVLNAGDKAALLNAINTGNSTQAMSVLRSASPYLSSDVLSAAIRSGILSDDSLNAILHANSPLPEDAMRSLIADVTIAAGNSAPDIQVAAGTVSSTSTDNNPEVNVSVNSIDVHIGTTSPSVGITASSVDITDSTIDGNIPDSLQSVSQNTVTVAVNAGTQSSTGVSTAVGRMNLDINGISKADSVVSLINFYDADYNRKFDELTDMYLSDTTINGRDSVIVMLEQETDVNRKMQLVQAYIAKGDYSHANSALAGLQQYPELSNFNALQSIMITLKQQQQSFYNIKSNAALYQNIQSIANDSLHAGYSGARAILTVIDGIHYPEVNRFNATSSSYRKRREIVNTIKNEQKLLRNYPNPFNHQTIIEAQVDDKIIHPMLVIYDMIGRTILSYKIQNGFNSITVSGNLLKPGVYYYSIVSDEKRIATEKMICTE